MSTIEKTEIARLLGNGLHIFLNGRMISCETGSDVDKLKENLEFYQAALLTRQVPIAQNGFYPLGKGNDCISDEDTAVAEQRRAAAEDKLVKYEWHRVASKQIAKPATFRELFAKIRSNGVELNAKSSLDALTRRIREDDQMVKVGRLPSTGQGAGEVLYAHRDLNTQDTQNVLGELDEVEIDFLKDELEL